MGIISVNGLKLRAYHGVYQQERLVGNDFVVSVSLDVPISDVAMDSDRIEDTLNYAEIIEIIKKEMLKPSQLLERVAGRIQYEMEKRWPDMIAGGEIKIEKLAPPVAAELDSVAFTVRW